MTRSEIRDSAFKLVFEQLLRGDDIEELYEIAEEIEEITGKSYEAINIVGGGANADYLSQLTANSTGQTVYAGPTEATALGNLVAQMIWAGEYQSLEDARRAIFESFAVKAFEAN